MRSVEETKQNLIDAINHIEPKKVPVGVDVLGWSFGYANTAYDEVMTDPEKCAEAFCRFFVDHPIMDMDASNAIANSPIRALDALGMDNYVLSSDKTSVVHNQAGDVYFGPEMYDWIIEDADTFMNKTFPEHMLSNLMKKPFEEAKKDFERACDELRPTMATDALVYEKLCSELQIYGLYDESEIMYYSPFNMIFDKYRGIRNALVDLRRCRTKVLEACDALYAVTKPVYDIETIEPLAVYCNIFHSECFVSPKDFEITFFEKFKDALEPAMKAGKKVYILGEGAFLEKMHVFRDLPKSSLLIQLDKDDIFEVKKQYGDWISLSGGVKMITLQNGTPEECRDEVKESFEKLAPGGGYVFFPEQELLSGKDARPENLVAALEEADRLSRQ